MLVHKHVIFGAIFSLIFFFIFPSITWKGAAIIFLSSVLIDFDHYLYYAFKKKDLNPWNAYKWFMKRHEDFFKLTREQRNNLPKMIFIFHGLEVLGFIFLLGIFYNKIFLLMFIGVGFHLILDLIYQTTLWDRIEKVSLVGDFMRV